MKIVRTPFDDQVNAVQTAEVRKVAGGGMVTGVVGASTPKPIANLASAVPKANSITKPGAPLPIGRIGRRSRQRTRRLPGVSLQDLMKDRES